jgi:hypothetical protein
MFWKELKDWFLKALGHYFWFLGASQHSLYGFGALKLVACGYVLIISKPSNFSGKGLLNNS